MGLTSSVLAEQPANTLTRAESVAGWKLLFDGQSTQGWRNYKKEKVSEGWKVVDGAIVRDGNNAGDIITDQKYKYFELSLEYNISKGGNSGLMFHVTEDNPAPWHSGPEVQIQDNVEGHDPQKAGWLYQMYQPYPMRWAGETEIPDATRPPGQWNQLFLRISPRGCEVSMNGVVYYQFNLGDKRWDELVAKSKFSKFPGFAKAGQGHVCLQDHGNPVSFRNIKIRELSDEGTIAPPVDGKLNLKPTLAFPKLKWENWVPVDEDGTVNRPRRTLELTYAPGDSKRLYVLDQGGTIYSFEKDPEVELAKVFLEIGDRVSKWNSPGGNEQGLLGLAMHPKFQENGEFFVCYTKPNFKIQDHAWRQAQGGSEFRGGFDGRSPAVPESQWWSDRVWERWVSLHRLWRWRGPQRSEGQWSGPFATPGLDFADRCRSKEPECGLCDPCRQPVCGGRGCTSGNLRLWVP